MTNPPLPPPPPPWGDPRPTSPPPPFAQPPSDPGASLPPGPPPSAKRYKILGLNLTATAIALIALGLIVILFCGGVGILAAVVPSTTTTTLAASPPVPTKPPVPSTTSAPRPTAAPTTPAPQWPAVPLDKASAEARLRSQKLEPSAVQVNGGTVTVRYKPTVWDENDMVQRAGDNGLKTARALFDHPAVEAVRTEMAADFTDPYGKQAEEVAVWSLIHRSTIEKIDWDGLARRVAADGSDWLCIADSRGSHPGVRARVETKRCLT